MVNFFSKMEDLGSSAIKQIRRVCLELERSARETVERAQSGLIKRSKLHNHQSINHYQDNASTNIPGESNESFAKGVPNYNSSLSTSLPTEGFGDGIANGYMDQDSMFGMGLPLWNSENLHEDLLSGFLPQYYGQLDMQLGDE